MIKNNFPFFATLALLSFGATAHPLYASSQTGDSVTCATSPYFIFSCSTPGATVGPGIEFTLTNNSNALTADFTGTDLILTDPSASNLAFTDTFGPGITLNFSDLTNAFTSATFVFASTPVVGSGFNASDFSFSGGVVSFQINGVTFQGGGTVDISLATASTVAATPEPESLLLVGPAMLAMAAFRRKLRFKA